MQRDFDEIGNVFGWVLLRHVVACVTCYELPGKHVIHACEMELCSRGNHSQYLAYF